MTNRIRNRATVAGVAVGLVVSSFGGASVAVAKDKDCKHFDSQRQAQKFFKRHGGPDRDPHRLDADGDGKACEDYDY